VRVESFRELNSRGGGCLAAKSLAPSRTALLLGIARQTLRTKLSDLGRPELTRLVYNLSSGSRGRG
jgi:hypothetical protein